MRTYEQFIMQYGTPEEKAYIFSEEGMSNISQLQHDRAYAKLNEEQQAEVNAGIASIDDYLTDNDLEYWRKAGARAAMFDTGSMDLFLDPDDEDDRIMMEAMGLL